MLDTRSPSLSSASCQKNQDALEIHSFTLNSVKRVSGKWSLFQEDVHLVQLQVSFVMKNVSFQLASLASSFANNSIFSFSGHSCLLVFSSHSLPLFTLHCLPLDISILAALFGLKILCISFALTNANLDYCLKHSSSLNCSCFIQPDHFLGASLFRYCYFY